jgi:hypothetical protein
LFCLEVSGVFCNLSAGNHLSILKPMIMIPFLIYTLLRKHFAQAWAKFGDQIDQLKQAYLHLFITCLFWIIAIFHPFDSSGQNTQLQYKVIYNGKNIGWLRLDKSITGNKLNLLLTSEITTKIVFPITVFTKEFSTFENGNLVYSSLIRKTNGRTKEDTQIKLNGNVYEVIYNGEKGKLPDPLINNNLLGLFFKEPATLKSVFCDKKQCYIKVSKCQDGGYETKFSRGNSNCFYYNKDGICTKVKIEHLFYNAEIVFVR